MDGRIAAALALGFLAAFALYYYYSQPPAFVHDHADFAVFINGAQFDFSQENYMESEAPNGTCVGETGAHLHGLNGFVAHKHAAGLTWGGFFSEIGFAMNETCLVTDENRAYCTNSTHSLKFFADGDRVDDLAPLEIKDLSKVLVSYGNDSDGQVAAQALSITDFAKTEPKGESCAGE